MRSYEVEDYDRKVKSRGQTVGVFEGTVLLNCADVCFNQWFGKDRAEMYVGEDGAASLGIISCLSRQYCTRIPAGFSLCSRTIKWHISFLLFEMQMHAMCHQDVSPDFYAWVFPKVWPCGRWHWHCCGQEGHPEASFRAKTEKQYVRRMTYCVHHSSFLVLASSCFYPFNLKSPLESPLHMALSWSFCADWPTSHDMFLFCFLSGLKMIQQMRYGMTNLYRMSDLLFKWYTYNNTYHLINDVLWEGMTYHMAWNFAWYDISHQTKITYHITFYAVECCSLFQ